MGIWLFYCTKFIKELVDEDNKLTSSSMIIYFYQNDYHFALFFSHICSIFSSVFFLHAHQSIIEAGYLFLYRKI